MAATDFITAFGRLLRDGDLRDVFNCDPQAAAEQVQLRPADCPAWSQLVPHEVEFQAGVLLRKRLDLVKTFAPETSRRLGEKLWPVFHRYARVNWPPAGSVNYLDAFHFCQQLKRNQPEVVVGSEWNRLVFAASSRRVGLHWTKVPTSKGRARLGLQFFLRGRTGRWREFFVYPGW